MTTRDQGKRLDSVLDDGAAKVIPRLNFPDDSLISYLRKVSFDEAGSSRMQQQSRHPCKDNLHPSMAGKEDAVVSDTQVAGSYGEQEVVMRDSGKQKGEGDLKKEAEENKQEEQKEEEEEEEEEDLELTVTPSALQSYTMVTLRLYVRQKKIQPRGTRKQDLIEAILAHAGYTHTTEFAGEDHKLEEIANVVVGRKGSGMKSPSASSSSSEESNDGARTSRPRRAKTANATTSEKSAAANPIAKKPAARKKKRTGNPHTKKEGPLPMILNEKGELVYDRHAHLRNRENGSCHRCKNKKKQNVVCPFAKSHLFCRACIERHCGYDYDEMRENVEKHWSGGCPVCKGICDCAYCKRTRKTGAPITPIIPQSATALVSPNTLLAMGGKVPAISNRKRKSPDSKEKRRIAKNNKNKNEYEDEGDEDDEEREEEEEEEEEGEADADDDAQFFLRTLKGEAEDKEEGDDETSGGDQSPFRPRHRVTPIRKASAAAANNQKKKRRMDDLTSWDGSSGFDNFDSFKEEQQKKHVVRVSPAVIRKDGHYELLQKEASVEAYIGLTGASQVLNHRHRRVTPVPPVDD